MDGYLFTGSEFENNLFDLLTRIKSSPEADSLNLNFVGEKVCQIYEGAKLEDIRSFIFNQANAKAQCNSKSSDIPNMIDTVLQRHPDDVNMLVSDCILSLDHHSTDYLSMQQSGIMGMIASALHKNDFSTLVVKFNSGYQGTYYSEANQGSAIPLTKKIRRPYYLLIFAKPGKINALKKTIQGFEHQYEEQVPQQSKPDAVVIRDDKIGNFQIQQPAASLTINNAQPEAGVLQFSVAANMQDQDTGYLNDKTNYNLPTNYSLQIIQKNPNPNDPSLNGFTHIYTIKTTDLNQNQEVALQLKSRIPTWIKESTNTDDTHPEDDRQQQQTFGFQYLMQGIHNAYQDVYKDKDLASIEIKISKDSYGSQIGKVTSFPWWVIVVGLALISLIIYLRRKK